MAEAINQIESTQQKLSISSGESKKHYWFSFEKNELLLLFCYFCFGIAFANYEPYAPIWLEKIFNVDSFLILGLVFILPNIVLAIGMLVWGIIADKYGIKKFIILGISAFLIMFFLLILTQFFTQSVVYFLAIIFIGHLIGSAETSNFYALATKSINKPKEIILAKVTIVSSLSWVIYSPICGYIFDNYSNSMTIQLSIAIITSFISLLVLFFVKEKKKEPVIVENNIQKEEKKSIVLSRVPFLFAGLMIVIFTFLTTSGFWAYTSIFFIKTLEISAKRFSIFLIIKTLLAMPLAMLLGLVKSNKGIGKIVIFFTLWMTMVYSIMSLFSIRFEFPSNWILFLIIYSIPMYPLNNVSFYALVTNFSNNQKRATAYGIFNTIGTAGYILGIFILGLVADSSPMKILIMLPVSVIYSFIAFVCAILFFVFGLRKSSNTIQQEKNI